MGSKKMDKFNLTISVPQHSPSHVGEGKEDCRGEGAECPTMDSRDISA